ncbi:hypothetical protein SELMODRAFT_408766 [Selaginella moellendorffii]|uniref:Uncharacterized protein n=1 Tax=Selaginella moellendorffii TaxID=88036 RepID=D8R9X0_SELML|nr:hypothetical protein SELMODRAFT_408766 [Selaginella moellendorffii]
MASIASVALGPPMPSSSRPSARYCEKIEGYRDCFGEDCLSSQLLIKAMVDVCEIGNTVPGELKSPEEEIRDSRLNYTEDEELKQLIHENVCMVDYPGEGTSKFAQWSSYTNEHGMHPCARQQSRKVWTWQTMPFKPSFMT